MKNGRIVCIPDLHVPFHDVTAWRLALSLTKALRPDVVVCLGDFADMQSMSLHGAEFGVKAALEHELAAVRVEWKKLEKAAGKAKVVCCIGNHSTRLLRYVAKNAGALECLIPDFSVLYGMSPSVRVIPYQQEYRIGKTVFLHDCGFAGKTATLQTLQAVGSSVVHGHTHRATIVYSGEIDGTRRFGMSPGWLGDVSKITYMPPSTTREWQHGVGVVDYRDGLAFAHIIPIVKGCAFFEGKMYK